MTSDEPDELLELEEGLYCNAAYVRSLKETVRAQCETLLKAQTEREQLRAEVTKLALLVPGEGDRDDPEWQPPGVAAADRLSTVLFRCSVFTEDEVDQIEEGHITLDGARALWLDRQPGHPPPEEPDGS